VSANTIKQPSTTAQLSLACTPCAIILPLYLAPFQNFSLIYYRCSVLIQSCIDVTLQLTISPSVPVGSNSMHTTFRSDFIMFVKYLLEGVFLCQNQAMEISWRNSTFVFEVCSFCRMRFTVMSFCEIKC
jgi:hypothetical protein